MNSTDTSKSTLYFPFLERWSLFAIFVIVRKRKCHILILVLVYLIGLAHNLVPHVDAFPLDNDVPHLHEHHTHTGKSQPAGHSRDIAHADHYDSGLYDLLLCFLNESEHSGGDCHSAHERITKAGEQYGELICAPAIVPKSHFAISQFVPQLPQATFQSPVKQYLPPLATAISHRGPPLFSC